MEEFKGDLDDYQKWLNEQNALEAAKIQEIRPLVKRKSR
ncbi:ABC transporter ATP-binding protein [Actinobacillus equuli]|nr:ABC transporter ATP-binding protein [Actinobacillus equuli]